MKNQAESLVVVQEPAELTGVDRQAAVQAKFAAEYYMDAFAINQDGFSPANALKVFYPKNLSIKVLAVDEDGFAEEITLTHEGIIIGLRPTVAVEVKKAAKRAADPFKITLKDKTDTVGKANVKAATKRVVVEL